MAELADAQHSKCCVPCGRVGSTPSFGTFRLYHHSRSTANFYPLFFHPVVSSDDAIQTPAVERRRNHLNSVGRAQRPFIGRLAAALLGLAIGIAIGLGIAWGLFWPVQYANADPADLRLAYKDDYIRMVGAMFEMDADLAGAKRRLSLLNSGSPAKTVNDFLAREKDRSKDWKTQAAVFHLAQVLYGTVAFLPPTPMATAAPAEGALGLSKPAVPVFRLIERTPLTCDDEPVQAHLRLVVRDARGADLPNVAIEVRWSLGDDTVYTGFKPERGVGYADYTAAPDTYTVTILNASGDSATLPVGDPPLNCQADRGATPRGWKLVFKQE